MCLALFFVGLAILAVVILCATCMKKSKPTPIESYEDGMCAPRAYQQVYGQMPVRASLPEWIDLKQLRTIADSNKAANFLYNVMIGDGNNGNPSLPSYGFLFCVYTPKMFSGNNDVRKLLRAMKVTSIRAKIVMDLLLVSMDGLVRFYDENGISNPCDKFNLFVQHVQPIKTYIYLIAAFLADLIPLTQSGEITLP